MYIHLRFSAVIIFVALVLISSTYGQMLTISSVDPKQSYSWTTASCEPTDLARKIQDQANYNPSNVDFKRFMQPGTLIKVSNEILPLSGKNDYSTVTTIKKGSTLAANALRASSVVDIEEGGILDLGAENSQIKGLMGYGKVQNNGNKDAILTFGSQQGGFYGGVITDGVLAKVGIKKVGLGDQTLLGKNKYTGGSEVAVGTLIGTTDSLQGNFTIQEQASLAFDQNYAGTFMGSINGSGNNRAHKCEHRPGWDKKSQGKISITCSGKSKNQNNKYKTPTQKLV